MASKQRSPQRGPETEPSRGSPASEVRAPEVGLEVEGPRQVPSAVERPTALAPLGEAERIALALCVAPRDGAWTKHLVELVGASGLGEDRRAEVAGRLEAAQAAADHVAGVVRGAFGSDSPELRAALLGALREPAPGAGLAEGVAAAVGQPESAVRALCDGLGGWVGWWWDEEEEEEAAPGDYAAEEGGS